MNKIIYYALGFVLCLTCSARADIAPTADGSEVWVLTLETIKAKATGLMSRNTALSAEYNALAQDVNDLNVSINGQINKNAALADFLKSRHGRPDQQMRLEELAAEIKDKKSRLNDLEQETDGLKGQAAALERKVQLKQLRVSEWELKQNTRDQTPAVRAEDPLEGLRKQLEAEKTKEVRLEDEFTRLADAPLAPVADNAPRRESIGRYTQALGKKAELEAKIRDLEVRFGQMAKLGGGGGTEKKKLIHDIVQTDNVNQDLRGNAAHLREDVALLREQIGKLERGSGSIRRKP